MPTDLMPPRPAICVFCGSLRGADSLYVAAARRFGALIAQNGFDLVFGGGGIGLMGEVARAVSEAGGRVLGIMPDFLKHLEPPLSLCTELILTADMNERKARMFAAADAFAILPGGLGTLDEFSEALTHAQLKRLAKPIVLVNINNYFAPLIALLDHFTVQEFAAADLKTLFDVATTPEDAMAMLRARMNAPA